ncbi:tRNA wybutosine-synthesizing protein 3 homolog isoform X2 [Nilaparvata lugens]|uniref:tRNA wybutosine-synthesizing protein 3 homolog isoform X2 n=1 Tax=Nilaparvata lugens TaxID=108931 RepID=UPI00193E835C|nr:tRNA wybutosine-synthesizing protein 3 homolog isoform X2 [Nilaparvata lugens]
MEMTVKCFKNQKKQILDGVDLSKKGSFDVLISNLICKLNDHQDYVTTSSCSGRILLYVQDSERRKQDCRWLFVSHDSISEDVSALHEKFESTNGEVCLKFEPFILHVQCRTIKSAKSLQTCVLHCGLRNSGLVIGNHGKIMLGVRCSNGMEIPITDDHGTVLVSDEYLKFIVRKMNSRMDENKNVISRFESEVDMLFK